MPASPTDVTLKLYHKYIQNTSIPKHIAKPFNLSEAQACADLYDDLHHDPKNIVVQASYHAFIEHMVAQFKEIIDEGFEIVDGKGVHNYATSDELRKDISNRRIVYLPTYSNDKTYSEITEDHPLSGSCTINDVNYCLNDIFRIVHDFYGHGMGHSFGPKGEHYAWLAHRNMFPLEAHLALWCETSGQSSWVNFGRHIRDAEVSIPLSNRPFAQQKCGIVPSFVI